MQEKESYIFLSVFTSKCLFNIIILIEIDSINGECKFKNPTFMECSDHFDVSDLAAGCSGIADLRIDEPEQSLTQQIQCKHLKTVNFDHIDKEKCKNYVFHMDGICSARLGHGSACVEEYNRKW